MKIHIFVKFFYLFERLDIIYTKSAQEFIAKKRNFLLFQILNKYYFRLKYHDFIL